MDINGDSIIDVRTESAGVVGAGAPVLLRKYQAATARRAITMIAHNQPNPPRFGSTLISAISPPR